MKPLALTINCRGALPFIAVLSAIVCFSTSVLAVEDGLGTNVVRNLRVQDGGYLDVPDGWIRLNGVEIMDWDDLSTDIAWDSMQTALSLSNHVAVIETSTNVLNVRAGNLETSTNTLNIATNSLQIEITTLNTATNSLDWRVYAIDQATTGTVVALQNSKYNKGGGPITGDVTIVGAVTMNSNVVYTPSAAITVDGTVSIVSLQAVEKIVSSGADKTMTIDPPIVAGTAGQMLTFIYDGAGSVTLTNNVSLKLDGGVSFTMKDKDVIQFLSDGATGWIETHRADNQ